MAPTLSSLSNGNLQNNGQIVRSSLNPVLPQVETRISTPVLPPRPSSLNMLNTNASPYSGYGNMGYGSYGSLPYRNSYLGSYNNYSGYGSYGINSYPPLGGHDDAETRFIQFAEESSRHTFSNIENIVRAFSSIAMMLDNTFFAMTSSFRAVLSVAENFSRLRSTFAHIWYSISVFRLFRWLHKKFLILIGKKEYSNTLAWSQATGEGSVGTDSAAGGSSWSTLAFLGALVSAPYIISKLLPKYEDQYNPANWKSPGVTAKAVFNFVGTSQNELTLHTNDEVLLAPTYIQNEMKLTNTGWAFASCNGKTGVIPLNYIVLVKKVGTDSSSKSSTSCSLPIPRPSKSNPIYSKPNVKRVSFGENQIIEDDVLHAEKQFDKESSECK